MYLHYATKYVVKYNDAWDFPYQMYEINCVLSNHSVARYGDTQHCDSFSCERGEIERLICELKESTDSEEEGIQVEDLICFFQQCIEEADPNNSDVFFAWF